MRKLTGNEFFQRILDGEREFRRPFMMERFDAVKDPLYYQVKEYLEKEVGTFRDNPICIYDSVLVKVSLKNLRLPYLKAQSTHLTRVSFEGSGLNHADFYCARLRNVSFRSTRHEGAKFEGAKFKIVNGLSDFFGEEELYGCIVNNQFVEEERDTAWYVSRGIDYLKQELGIQ